MAMEMQDYSKDSGIQNMGKKIQAQLHLWLH